MKKINKLFFLKLIICCLLFTNQTSKLYAQENVIPPSPDASALGSIINTPVDLNVGTPDISIPIYSLDIKGNIQVKIELQNKANALFVEEIASSFGLGWILTYGGVITRTVRGIPDDYYQDEDIKDGPSEGYGWLNCNNDIVNFFDLQSDEEKRSAIYKFRDDRTDTEPDLFFFSAGKYSGKFHFDNNNKISPLEAVNLKFSYSKNENGINTFTIIDDSGNVYIYSDYEKTNAKQLDRYRYWDEACVNAYGYYYEHCLKWTDATLSNYSYNSSWYLSKIITSSNEIIEFDYFNEENYNYLVNNLYEEKNKIRTFIDIINGKSIKSITYKNQKISFTYSSDDRKDLPGKKAIEKISIENNNKLFKEYQFGFDYFYSVGYDDAANDIKKNYCRLKLNSITEISESYVKPPYIFEYNEDEKLPHRESMEQDMWGYYNAKGQTSLLPEIHLYLDKKDRFRVQEDPNYNGVDYHNISGADRTPDIRMKNGSVETVMDAFMLTSITSPLGGILNFEFEPHSYIYENNKYYGGGVRIKNITSIPDVNEIGYTKSYKYIETDINETSGILIHKPIFAHPYFAKESEFYSSKFNRVCSTNPEISCANHPDSDPDFYINMIKRMSVNLSILGTYDGSPIMYSTVHEIEHGKGKTITSFDVHTPYFSESYSYNGIPYIATEIAYNILNEDGFTYCDCEFPLMSMNDFPFPPNTDFSWSRGQVMEIKKYNNSNMLLEKSIYKYDNPSNYKTTYALKYSQFHFPISSYPSNQYHTDWICHVAEDFKVNYVYGKYKLISNVKKNVQEVETIKYSGSILNDTIFGKTVFSYNSCNQIESFAGISSSNDKETKTYIKYVSDFKDEIICQSEYDACFKNAVIKYLECWSGCVQDGGGDACMNTCRAFNNLRKEICNKQHESCLDNYDDNSLAIETMINRNIVSPVVEKYETVIEDGIEKVIGGELNQYKIYEENFVKLNKNSNLELAVPISINNYQESTINSLGDFQSNINYSTNIFYDQYTNGKLSQFHKANDIPNSYMWGYKGQYPIAKAVNAKYNDIYYTSFDDEPIITPQSGENYTIDYTKSKTGKASLKSVNYSAYEYLYFLPFVEINNAIETTYKYSAWVYSNGPTADLYFFYKPDFSDVIYSTGWKAKYITTNETGKWVYIEGEVTVPPNYKCIFLRMDNNGGGTVWFDDVKFWEENAQLTTYTYEPLVGMTSATDHQGRTTTYEYDDFGRLKLTKDHNGNIVNKYSYHYKGQEENTGTGGDVLTANTTNTALTALVNVNGSVTFRAVFSNTGNADDVINNLSFTITGKGLIRLINPDEITPIDGVIVPYGQSFTVPAGGSKTVSVSKFGLSDGPYEVGLSFDGVESDKTDIFFMGDLIGPSGDNTIESFKVSIVPSQEINEMNVNCSFTTNQTYSDLKVDLDWCSSDGLGMFPTEGGSILNSNPKNMLNKSTAFTVIKPFSDGTYYLKARLMNGSEYLGFSKIVSFTIGSGEGPGGGTGGDTGNEIIKTLDVNVSNGSTATEKTIHCTFTTNQTYNDLKVKLEWSSSDGMGMFTPEEASISGVNPKGLINGSALFTVNNLYNVSNLYIKATVFNGSTQIIFKTVNINPSSSGGGDIISPSGPKVTGGLEPL